MRKKVYPYKPHFHHIKVGNKGVFIAWTCLHDADQTLTDNAAGHTHNLIIAFVFCMTTEFLVSKLEISSFLSLATHRRLHQTYMLNHGAKISSNL